MEKFYRSNFTKEIFCIFVFLVIVIGLFIASLIVRNNNMLFLCLLLVYPLICFGFGYVRIRSRVWLLMDLVVLVFLFVFIFLIQYNSTAFVYLPFYGIMYLLGRSLKVSS